MHVKNTDNDTNPIIPSYIHEATMFIVRIKKNNDDD